MSMISGHEYAVVVEVPEGVPSSIRNQVKEGDVLDGNAMRVAESKGVVLLPVEPELLQQGGGAGWVKRSYGRGWMFNPSIAGRGCPLALYFAAQYKRLYWKARLVATGEEITGSLRLAMDTGQPGASACGFTPETSPVLMPSDSPIVGGSGVAMLNTDTWLGLMLYGMATGIAVEWFAISQAR